MIRDSRKQIAFERRALRTHLLVLGLVGVAVLGLGVYFDLFEDVRLWLENYEHIHLDEVLFAAFVVVTLFAGLSVRRWVRLARHDAERDRAVRAFRDERDFTSAVVDTVSSLILVLDRDGTILRFNPACQEVSGFLDDEIVGRPYWELLIPPEAVEARRDEFIRLISHGGSTQDEVSWVAKDGTPRIIAWTHNAVPDETGRPAYVVATGRDVTEERRSREALRRTEERLEGILQTIDDFVWSQDAATREMLYISPSVERIYGFKPEAMKANTRIWLEVIHPDDRERVASYLPSLLADGRANAEYRIVREDGSIRWVHDRAWAIHDEAGKTVRFDGIVRDVTDQKHLESQFRQSQKMEAVGLLAGGIAHDFNNLLTAIGGYAELLLERLDAGDPRREQAEAVKRAGLRAAALTRQLLAFSRRQVLQPRVVDLNELVGDMEPLLRRVVGEDVEIVVKRAPGLGAVRVDASQVEQVLMNLVVNARDAMPDGGRLTIRTENVVIDAGSHVALGVSDTGVGMDEAVRSRIFEPFFTTKPLGKGTGLGLSTAYGIVEQSGGHIEVESTVGSGTTFRVLLPLCQESWIPEGPTVGESRKPAAAATLLLVEDEPTVRELAYEILAADGYDVITAADGREALEAARRHADRIRLVITDIVMPQMGGLELVEGLAGVIPEAPVLFMSGYSESAVRGEPRFALGAGFLQKPFTPSELLRHAREALEGARRPRS